VDAQQLTLGCLPALCGQLDSFSRAQLGTEKHGLEGNIQPGECEASRACLLLAATRKAALEVVTDAMRLRLCMSK
jgi:hypothetical protein